MKSGFAAFIGAALLTLAPQDNSAQTCSCAAVPLLGTMQSASPDDGRWYLGTTFEFHDVSDLVAGSDSIPDLTGRDRSSQAMILEASRGLTENWSITAIAAAVTHEREIGGAEASASGLSDAVVMARYAFKTISLYSDTALAFGIGARVPIGRDDARIQGIVLAEDMQPSTGAFGSTLWAYWAKALNDSRRTQIYASATVSQRGENDRTYQFGDDTLIAFGTSLKTPGKWGYNLELAYRNAGRDQRNSVRIPNTGGEWLDLRIAAQYNLSETIALGIAAKGPLRRNLHDELQFTSKFAMQFSLSYVFGNRQ